VKKNIAYILSFVNKSISFEWIVESLDKSKYTLYFILLNKESSPLEEFLLSKGIAVYRIPYEGKKDVLSAIIKTQRILKKNKTDILHAHLFDASLVGLVAAKLNGIKKRIHTRHNSTIHHNYFPHAVKYDKLINRLSTKIVAVSDTVRKVLIEMEGVNEKKITVIHHGFALNEFTNISEQRIQRVYSKYKLSSEKKIYIGVISRYIHWKGIQYIIPAFAKLLAVHPNAHLVLANADGPYNEVAESLKTLPETSYTEIKFEEDIFALYKLFSIFIHTPIDAKSEAFGQVYVEAMAAGVPSIVTLSGIANDFVIHKKNALVVPFKNSTDIYNCMKELLENEIVRRDIIENGKKIVEELFSLEKMIESLEKLYE